ncbi:MULTISPECIES: serine racemase VanT catalytic subunit [unclassified Lysinibacillus]|uniref:serine racemase VanT catalytic subunit n=1 Tax=unclassified Lysinibacillus TaxID=2636778 RepID=UPI00380A0F94
MNKNRAYVGIDYFRFAAALLVIAVHTSPLFSYSETVDFILTRIIARIAVPFFFMTSGFFLISRYNDNSDKLKIFLKKTSIIYVIAILLYVPLNIYNGYFSMDNLLPNIMKDIVFDGTLYHLWYLPASIIGAAIAWYLLKRVGVSFALIVTMILYVVGMLGDSYYGFAEKIPFLKKMFELMFEVADYTRNGLFFAPLFFVLGGIIADKAIKVSLKKSVIGFVISLALLFGEGMALHQWGVQRHDSMYMMLLPCMFFLFNALTYWKGKRIKALSSLTLIVYIIHPMIIVLVRMLATILRMQPLLVENSLIHYVVVSVLSIVASIVILRLYSRLKLRYRKKVQNSMNRSWIEVDLNNLEHNVRILQGSMPKDCELMAVVKADAYGHRTFEVSTFINQIGVKAFAVATIDEGIKLRKYGVKGEILILGYTCPTRAKELHKYSLIQSLIDYNYAVALSHQGYNLKSHIKIDTGMKRLGFDVDDIAEIIEIFKTKQLGVCGIYTHLCVSDSLLPKDVEFTQIQISRFYSLIGMLLENGVNPNKVHIQSSYGLLNYPELQCDYVRAGIALYGVLSSPTDQTKLKLDLKPVLSLKSKVILIRAIKEGETVGYGRAFTASRNSLIAILPIGYADGVPRNLSCGKGNVLIDGYQAPIVGRICMDHLAIDVTDIPHVAVDDIATIIGRDGEMELTAPEVANNSGSLSNELLSRLGTRLMSKTK